MPQLVALSVSIAVLGALATFAFLHLGLPIWAAFLAWACFFHSGGNAEAFKSTVVCNLFGAVAAWVAAVVILAVPLAGALTLPGWAALVVGATVLVVCLAAHSKPLSNIPASFYGYAGTAAFFLQTKGALALPALTSATLANALVAVVASMILGAVLGFASGKLGAMLTARAPSVA